MPPFSTASLFIFTVPTAYAVGYKNIVGFTDLNWMSKYVLRKQVATACCTDPFRVDLLKIAAEAQPESDFEQIGAAV